MGTHLGIKVSNLIPRPADRCGKLFNKQWQVFERNHLGAVGRAELCEICPERYGCPWPLQYGEALKGSQVIFATQTHLEHSPFFVPRLKQWTAMERVLLLLDEINFMMKPYRQHISATQLSQFIGVLKLMSAQRTCEVTEKWLCFCVNLQMAHTEDLRVPDWKAPGFSTTWAYRVQHSGWQQLGKQFVFLGYELQHFNFSPLESRGKTHNGTLTFSVMPCVDEHFIIYSGTSHQALSEYRLGKAFAHPFSEYRFEHPQTRWHNIASRIGTRKHFKRNATQVLDFFAQLTAQRLRAGKRVLWIAKKCFLAFCADEMMWRLKELGLTDISIVTDGFNRQSLNTPYTIPLINYGTIGTNLFEQFQCCFCLTGYYVTEEVVDNILQDLVAKDLSVPIRIRLEGQPLRRKAQIVDPKHRYCDLQTLAQPALDFQEMGTVLQAAGRVRPYTRPREIITFQCADHPTLDYTEEFQSVEEARLFFGIQTKRERLKQQNLTAVQAAKASGFTQKQTAAELGVGLRTVQRYWGPAPGRHEA